MNRNISIFALLSCFAIQFASAALSDMQGTVPISTGFQAQAVASNQQGTDVYISRDGCIAVRKNHGAWNNLPANVSDEYLDIIFADGKFVIVGLTIDGDSTFGIALTSTDGVNWSRYRVAGAYQINTVSYGNNKFVAGGLFQPVDDEYAAGVFTSSNAEKWMGREIDEIALGGFWHIRFLAGRFIAGVSLGSFFTSTDGVNWAEASCPPATLGDAAVGGMAANGKTVVAVGGVTNARAWSVSKDGGLTWGIIKGFETAGMWTDVVYSATLGKFVAVGRLPSKEVISISTNGSSWTDINLGTAAISQQLTGICNGKGGRLIAVGSGLHFTVLAENVDGDWKVRSMGKYSWEDTLFHNGTYFAVGGVVNPSLYQAHEASSGGAILKSKDAVHWTKVAGGGYHNGIVRGANHFVAVGDDILISVDGTNWSVVKETPQARLNEVAFGHGKYVAVGYSGSSITNYQIVTSNATATSWKIAERGGRNSELRAVEYASPAGVPTFIAVGRSDDRGVILRSVDDGATWKDVTPPISAFAKHAGEMFEDVTYAHGKFVVVGDGAICVSTNGGRTWSITPVSSFYNYLTLVEAGENEFYTASEIFGASSYSVLNAREPGNFKLTDTATFDPGIHSLTAVGTNVVVGLSGNSGAIAHGSTKPTVVFYSEEEDMIFKENAATGAGFVLYRNGSTAESLSVKFTVSGSATSGTDYRALTGTATFAAGSSKVKIPVVVNNDQDVETTEKVVLTISPNSRYILGPQVKQTMTILEDDVPTFSFEQTAAEVTEGDNLSIVVKRNTPTGSATVNFTPKSGTTATSLSDYALASSLTFAPGETTKTVMLETFGDSQTETSEALFVQLSLPPTTVGKVGTKSVLAVTIKDPVFTGGAALVTVSAIAATTVEGSFTFGTFRVERTVDNTEEIFVNVAYSGSATRMTDYPMDTSPIQLPAGINSVDVIVFSNQDNVVEADETVIITLQPGDGYTVGSPSAATVTIVDDDS